MRLSEKARKIILDLQSQYPEKRSALIPALHLAQSEVGYLPRETQDEIAVLFDLAPNEVHSVVTFYDMFHEHPTGKHHIHVCKNISCMLRGCDPLIATLCDRLKIDSKGNSADGQFTLIPSECLGACDLAPMMIVNEKVVGPIKIQDLDQILDEAKKTKGHACPVPGVEVSHG